MSNDLIFNESPEFELATNFFVNVPTILHYDDTPLIQVVQTQDASFTTEINIYHNDGTFLAKAKGTQLYLTDDGKKAGVTLRNPNLMTVCELNGATLFELTRTEAAALKGTAELFTPDGSFVKVNDAGLGGYILDQRNDAHLNINGMMMSGSHFEDCPVGIQIASADYRPKPSVVPSPHTRSDVRSPN